MHEYLDEYPPAHPSRVAEAENLFPYKDVSPEEYAAREGHRWLCFSFDECIYPDPVLNEWLHTLGDILAGGQLADLQRKYLSPQELAEFRRENDGREIRPGMTN